MRKREYLVVLVLASLIFILIVMTYSYLKENWEEIFGPEAEKFFEFDVINKDKEFTNNYPFYKINFKLTALKNMYSVEISPQNSSGITKITSLNEELPATRTLLAGAVVYPTMTVQRDKNTSYGWVVMQVSFMDIDAHEKKINKRVEIIFPEIGKTPREPGFEFVLAFVALSLVALFQRKRNKL